MSLIRCGGPSATRTRTELPPDYEKSFGGVWEYATAWDIGKAAKDWPQMTFVIYHSALRAFLELPDQAWAEFETTGRIKWAGGASPRARPKKVGCIFGRRRSISAVPDWR